MKVVIITPTYNEKGNIDRLIPILENEIFPKIKNHDMNILVADDNSPDGTANEVKKLMQEWKNLDVSSGERHGLGAAYVRAMTYAVEKLKADVMFEMDADFQHDPEKIPEFIKKMTNSSSEIIFEPLPEDDPKVRRPDINKAKNLIGWTPKVSIDQGLAKTIQYFKSL